MLLISAVVFLSACRSEEDNDETENENTEVEENDLEENEEDLDSEASESVEDVLTHLPDPLSIEETLWDLSTSNTDSQSEFTLEADIYPVVHNNEYAILPITFDSNETEDVNIHNLLGGSAIGSGEGLSNVQGYEVRLVDPENLLVYHIGVADNDLHEGSLQLTHPHLNIGAEQEEPVYYYAIFEAPETEEISVMLRRLGFFSGIPVVEDSEAFDILVAHYVEIEENEVDNLFENVQVRTHPLETYRVNLEHRITRLDEVEQSTLTLVSDVLFEFDEATLTEEADSTLEAAIQELEYVDGGTLEIVGHTDNEASEEYNQELSEDRAEAVHERLEELTDLLDTFDEIIIRGESFREPIADNDEEEGRALNRRVDLHFTPPTEIIEQEVVEYEVPEALGDEASYPDAVHVSDGGLAVDISVDAIRHIGNMFIGEITMTSQSDEDVRNVLSGFLQHRPGISNRGAHRSESAGGLADGLVAPTIIVDNQRYYPLDYYLTPLEGSSIDEEEDLPFIVPLAERQIPSFFHNDGYYTGTIVWPAVPNAEEVIVDLTVHEGVDPEDSRFERTVENTNPWRITNVPVEEE